MPTTLAEWQKYLEQHFAALASARVDSAYPLFSLEHGLEPDELRSIKELLRSQIKTSHWLASHWLVWVVYATEFGYEYFGDEYWQSFEEYTPHWRERGKREYLRDWFSKFQTTYDGIQPTGQWARSFSIIAWPITHAILPRYLQTQFAKALYDLRYELARLDDLSPRAIGKYIAGNIWDASSRFRVFLQQDELTGRLVLALLGNPTVDGPSPIYPPTLKRLVSDLEAARNAKEWLRETRRLVADRIEGARSQAQNSGTVGNSSQRADKPPAPHLRPKLMLRRSSPSTYSVFVEIPNFAPLVAVHPELRRFLMTTRCKIAGAWASAGSLLNGPYKRQVLKSWIGTNTPLVTFEKANPTLEQFVKNEVRLPPGPNWLFRIGKDGVGSEIAGKLIRPGRQYIMMTEGDLPTDNPLLTEAGVDCPGVRVATLAIPESLSVDHTRRSQQLGFQVARTVRIWPAGIPAKAWDGEGVTEWLNTDSPHFGIMHDYASVQAYSVRLDDTAPVRIDAPSPGEPVFIQLPTLSIGKHQLTVKAITSSATANLAMAEGVVTLSVREPQPWVPGTTHHSGLFVSLDPPAPSLDHILDGTLSMTILGPSGHQVTCALTLFGRNGEPLGPDVAATFNLPVVGSDWQNGFFRQLSSDAAAWKYLESTAARLVVRGDELGAFVINVDREITPVRLVCGQHHGAMLVRLVEDTGTQEPPVCTLYSFQHPTRGQPVAAGTFSSGHPVDPPGGLFLVRKGSFSNRIIASSSQVKGGLQGLAVEPDLHEFRVTPENLVNALEVFELWNEARLTGPLANLRRARVVNALLGCIYEPFCGPRWVAAEYDCRSQVTSEQVDKLQQLIGGAPGFAAILRRDYRRIHDDIQTGKAWFADAASRHGFSQDPGLCEFALQFASQPQLVGRVQLQGILPGLLSDLLKHSRLLRGARFLSILSASDQPAVDRILLPRWRW